jgi:hypothetical protein
MYDNSAVFYYYLLVYRDCNREVVLIIVLREKLKTHREARENPYVERGRGSSVPTCQPCPSGTVHYGPFCTSSHLAFFPVHLFVIITRRSSMSDSLSWILRGWCKYKM